MEDYQTLWAKKTEKDGQFFWLPLTQHLKDTMQVAGWLWNHWLSPGQRSWLTAGMQPADDLLAERLVCFLGAIHEIGKATPAFQIQQGYANSQDLDTYLLERLERAGFQGIADLELASPKSTHHSLAGEYLLASYGLHEDIASMVGAHHGKPIDDDTQCRDQEAYEANYYQDEDETSPIYKKWQAMQKAIYVQALQTCGFAGPEDLPELTKPGQVLLSGLLIMADWIASNETYFPLIPIDQLADPHEDRRFQTGMEKWVRTLPLELALPENAQSLYARRFGFTPSDIQQKIYDTVSAIQSPGIVIIEAPTGSGKTEAALAAAEQMAALAGTGGLFFGLPTQATSNGIFPRIHAWLQTLSHEYGNTSLRLVHGNAALNDIMNSLSSQINIDEGSEGSVSANAWFSGRKTASLDDFVVGTVDHFLLLSLKQKHLALRHLGYSKKVVIIDEVHAYDAYMQQYLAESLRWMGAYHVPVVLLSATLPAQIRAHLIKEYLKGQGLKNKDLAPYEDLFSSRAYPLVTFSDGPQVRQQTAFPSQQDRQVTVSRLADEDLYDTLADLIENGGVVGVIVNTVRRAQTIARACSERFGSYMVELVHAGFIASDRVSKEDRLMAMIGKNGDRPEKKIIIGTQVLEQSLDIDFDVLISDLCPVDLLLQRLGRLHRHRRNRPQAHQQPRLYLLGTSPDMAFESGSQKIYGAYLLAKTQFLLPEVLHIPSHVSPLVQKVYDLQEEPDIPEPVRDRYEQSKEAFVAEKDRLENKAKVFRIDNPTLKLNPQKYNLIGWLRAPSDSGSEERAYAQVRDKQETIEVIALQRRGGGYGTFRDEADLSARLDDLRVQKELARQTLRLPQTLTMGAKFDAVLAYLEDYNRKYLPQWQQTGWLKGSLGILFDENGRFEINGFPLHYDNKYGIEVEKKHHEQI